MDSHKEFASVNNLRGIIAMGDQVFVLHTTFSEETEKASRMNLVVYEDKDNDGIADGPSKPLIENISNPNYLRSRGGPIMRRTVSKWVLTDGHISP